MKVILIADVKNVGKKGDVVEVSDGYGQNFLIKKHLAVLQNKANLNDLNKQKEEERRLDSENREKAMALKKQLAAVTVVFKEQAGSEDRLHNAITAKMVEEKLFADFNLKVDKKNFKNFNPIKALCDDVVVEVVLYKDIVGKFKVEVVAK